MAEEPTTTPPPEGTEPDAGKEPDVEKQAFLERLTKESGKRKEAEKQAAEAQRQIAELQKRMDERESAGLPELEQVKKRLEQAEKRAEDADKRAGEFETQATNAQRERWVEKAATAANFIDADDASRYVDLAEIDSADDAERAVKRVAKAKKHLLKAEEPTLPGRVMQNGRATQPTNGQSNIDLSDEARMLAEGLKQFASRD